MREVNHGLRQAKRVVDWGGGDPGILKESRVRGMEQTAWKSHGWDGDLGRRGEGKQESCIRGTQTGTDSRVVSGGGNRKKGAHAGSKRHGSEGGGGIDKSIGCLHETARPGKVD